VTRIQEPLFVLSVAGLIYFLISFPISRLGARLEKKWREND
jgi:ABC-type amino acid transport system permease subunit